MTAVAPRARRRPLRVVRHGGAVDDPYAWLKPANWRQAMTEPALLDPEIRDHLEAERAYADTILAPTAELQERLYREMKDRIAPDDSTVPFRDGDYVYYERFAAGGEHPCICRRRCAPDAPEEVMLDGDAEATHYAFFRLGGAVHSPDARLLAYTVDTAGAERYAVRVRDLATGRDIDSAVVDAQPGVVWANDGRSFFYTALDANHRPCRVLRHVVGSPIATDRIVFEDPDPGFYLGVGKTESGRFIMITAHDHSETSDVHYVDADRPEATATPILPRRRGVAYDATEWRGRFIIRTNADGAEDFKIVEAPVDDPAREHWRELVPCRQGHVVVEMLVFDNWLAWRARVDGLPRIFVRGLPDGDTHEISFDAPACSLSTLRGFEYATDTLRFAYGSPVTPEQVYDYDMATRQRSLRRQRPVPGGYDPERYVLRRISAVSADGERVPVVLLHAKNLQRDGTAPLLLRGYGAYGAVVPAQFNPGLFSLADRGFVCATALIRGGGDLGQRWYRDGKLMKKKNSFRDFIAAAETLIAEGYTSAGRIVIHGRSAGGMLVGAAMNMRPELFRAVIAEVPFVDVLNTMFDPELPLTPPEWEEWGNPIEDAAACRYIASYCPYENVERKAYPHLLATAGIADPRVTFWEPTKWVAKLRALRTDENLTLLQINMEAGHAGAAGRYERLREIALLYAFALSACGEHCRPPLPCIRQPAP